MNKKWQFQVQMGPGNVERIVVEASNRKNAEKMAEAQTGGKVKGGKEVK